MQKARLLSFTIEADFFFLKAKFNAHILKKLQILQAQTKCLIFLDAVECSYYDLISDMQVCHDCSEPKGRPKVSLLFWPIKVHK